MTESTREQRMTFRPSDGLLERVTYAHDASMKEVAPW